MPGPPPPDGYTLHRPIGQGASAKVWLADGPDGQVALKVAQGGQSLVREIEALRRLAHGGIARLLDADPDGAWLAVEFAARGRADEWGRGQPLPVLVEFAAQVADALSHVHEEGLVHGDLKPSNVLVAADGTPRLIDMGEARPQEKAVPNVGGTLGFVAPELLCGDAPSPAADLYGLGVLLYQLLTRQAPFRDADPAALGYLPLATLPEPPSSLRPRLPRALDDLVLRLLARRPESRPPSAREVASLLRASVGTEPRAPVVGMAREREILRRHVVELLEGRPSVVVLHGNAGSGRRTLIRECVRAAQREGVQVVQSAGDRVALHDAVAKAGPAVLALDGNAPGVEPTATRILADGLPCLVLVRADRPLLKLARLGARHICPSALTPEDVSRVLEALQLDRRHADDLHRRSRGSPGALMGLLSDAPDPEALDPVARTVLGSLAGGPLTVPALADKVGLSEHRLLDVVEPMIDRGLVSASADGAWISGRTRRG
ncbi:MAG: serine/threonine-protein kinase [Myxococcota bacterium]